LGMNTECNAPSCQVERLFWGRSEPLTALGLKEVLDVVLAANVVYDPKAWDALLETTKALSGSNTLAVIADVCRPKLDIGCISKALSDEFEIKLLPQNLLHPAFCRHGNFRCLIHVITRKARSERYLDMGKEDGRDQ